MTKKITLGLLLFAVVTGFLGCKKYLDTDPLYQQDAENYFTKEEHYRFALIGAYDLLQGSFLHVWIGEIASDNSVAGGESAVDTKGLHDIDRMEHGAVNNELRDVFRWNYAGISRCNYIMEHKDNVNFDGKEQVLAETRFLRGYYYFQLVKFFGGVPLVIDERLGVEEVKNRDRASVGAVYAQIEGDLKYAIERLPLTASIKGRATKGAAMALLGKVYLYEDKFQESADILDQCIGLGQYDLISDYTQLFTVANEGHIETVFDVEYSGLEGGSYDCLICLEGNAAPGFHGIRQYKGPVYGDGNSYNLPTQDLYDFFDPRDTVRRNATILDIEAFKAAQEKPEDVSWAEGGGGHTGYYNNKYIKRQGEIGLPDNDLTSPVNYRVIRFADVLLMAAEAHNRNNNDGQALTYLNRVRARVNMPNITSGGDQLTRDIWNERRLELSGEGYRFFDLVRTGEAANEITGFVTGKHELFPIPRVEIDLTGGSWSQNPGY